MHAKADKPCMSITILPKGVGGLSNTVGYVNTGLHYAIEQKWTFIFPPIRPPAHHAADHYQNFFATDARFQLAVERYTKLGRLFSPVCKQPATRPLGPEWVREGVHLISKINTTYHGIASHSSPVYCFPWEYEHPLMDCRKPVLVQLPLQRTGTYHFNFTLTRPVFQRAYWRLHSRPGPAPDSPVGIFTTAIHMRLGDIMQRSMQRFRWKYTRQSFYTGAVALLFAVLPPHCVRLTLYSDNPKHSDVTALKQQLRQWNTTMLVRWRKEKLTALCQAEDFHHMAASHVLGAAVPSCAPTFHP
eukprot:GGOE01053283.1.p1 GENE.GGOE01053283.1~~GGOE01053283.1.p1  ORF type:complete len:331 (+),score=38.25 GGOE01053283.1:93-995(+)